MGTLEQFLKFEKDNDLFSRKYCEENYWQLLRNYIYRRITENPDIIETPQMLARSAQGLSAEKIMILMKTLRYAIQHYVSPKPKSANVLILDISRYLDVDGVRQHVFFDPIRERLTCESVYVVFNYVLPLTRKQPNIAPYMLKYYFCLVYAKTFRIYIDQEEGVFLDSLQQLLKQEFEVKIPLEPIVREDVIFIKSISKYAKSLLQKVNPKAVLRQGHNRQTLVITKEAKSLGIPVIELQHGVITKENIVYNYLDTIGSKIYSPNYLFTYGDYWSENIRTPQDTKVITVGYHYFESRMKKLRGIKKQDNLIVFYSNFNRYIINILLAMNQQAKEHNYKIICKMHPGETMWRSYYPELAESDIQVIDTRMDVYELLMSARHHVGGTSTVLFEAVGTGGGIHVHLSGKSILSDMIRAGAAKEFSSAEELMHNILKMDKRDSGRVDNSLIASYLFAPNALQNQLNSINSIIQNPLFALVNPLS